VSKRSFGTRDSWRSPGDLRRDGVALAMLSKPRRRATSSIRSASMRMSKRCGGRRTRQPVGVRLDAIADRPSTRAPRIRHARAEQPRQAARRSSPTVRPRPSPLGGARHLHRARLAARDLEQQRRRPLERERRQARIDAALEALRGIGEQAESAAPGRDRGGRKVRGLEQHVGGRIVEIAVARPPMMPARPTAPRRRR
jgi:hypothetical protein